MLKSYELTKTNRRGKAVDNIIIETKSINKIDNPDNIEIIDTLNEGTQLTYDSSIAEYFLECLIAFDLKKTTYSNKIDV